MYACRRQEERTGKLQNISGRSAVRSKNVWRGSAAGGESRRREYGRSPRGVPALSGVWAGQNQMQSAGAASSGAASRARQTYGHRRMQLWLEGQGIYCDPKTVLRPMKKYEVLAEIRQPRRRLIRTAASFYS